MTIANERDVLVVLEPLTGRPVDTLALQQMTGLVVEQIRSVLPVLGAPQAPRGVVAYLVPERCADGQAEDVIQLLSSSTWPPAAIVLLESSDLRRAGALGRAGAFAVMPADRPAEALAVVVYEARAVATAETLRRERFFQLTRREREVLLAISSGADSRAVAESLGIATATVKVHRKAIMRKLGVQSLVDLVRLSDRAWPRFGRQGPHATPGGLPRPAGAV
jgi:DNA-binding NarL/FixJ family response regulator